MWLEGDTSVMEAPNANESESHLFFLQTIDHAGIDDFHACLALTARCQCIYPWINGDEAQRDCKPVNSELLRTQLKNLPPEMILLQHTDYNF